MNTLSVPTHREALTVPVWEDTSVTVLAAQVEFAICLVHSYLGMHTHVCAFRTPG